METGEMEAFVMVAFEALEIQPIVCLERFDGIAYCGTFQPSYDDHWDPKPPAFADTFKRRFPDDLNGALPLTPWTKGEGYHWRSYVIDGIHVVKLYRIRKRGDTQLAIAFEGP